MTAETAVSAIEALEKFSTGRFDLVITDHVMAGMTGEQLALELKQLAPDVPVILLTGYACDVATDERRAGGIDLVLGKPLTRAALRNAISTVMAGREG